MNQHGRIWAKVLLVNKVTKLQDLKFYVSLVPDKLFIIIDIINAYAFLPRKAITSNKVFNYQCILQCGIYFNVYISKCQKKDIKYCSQLRIRDEEKNL